MKIDHIAVYVNDLEGCRVFFEKYFCASAGRMYHNPTTDFRSYFLSFDGGARLEIMQRPDVPDIPGLQLHTGYIHTAFGVGSMENVDALTERLRADGYAVTSNPRTTGDGYYESCVVGFENILIEITV